MYSAPGASFTYIFYQMYAKYATDTERFQNTRNALYHDSLFTQEVLGYLDYDARIWGNTALQGPDSAGFDVGSNRFISNYHAFGSDCKYDEHNDPNGTIAIYGGLMGMIHRTQATMELLKYYYDGLDSEFREIYGYEFWSPIFGFPDGFHLNPEASKDTTVNILDYNGPWISIPRFAIDIGPMLMMMDSYLKEKTGSKIS